MLKANQDPMLVDHEPQLVVQSKEIVTPLGPMVAAASEEALHLIEFTDRHILDAQWERLRVRLNAEVVSGSNVILEQTQQELDEYFAGSRTSFSIPLKPAATDFQQIVWDALQTIPFGETRSYGDQALSIGKPTATRAVASANGDNPITILIPCHRVIGSDGKLTGYGGGLHRKQFLLDLERRVAGKDVQLSLM